MKNEIKVEQIGGLSCEPTGALSHVDLRVAPLSWFASLGEPMPLCADTLLLAGDTFESLVEIDTDHTFNTGLGFMKLKGVQETVGLESGMIGEAKRKIFENKIIITVPGSDAALLGFVRAMKNEDLIVLGTEIESGRVRQIGSARNPAYISELTGKIDPTLEGDNSFAFTFSNKSVIPSPIYKGVITDMPAQP